MRREGLDQLRHLSTLPHQVVHRPRRRCLPSRLSLTRCRSKCGPLTPSMHLTCLGLLHLHTPMSQHRHLDPGLALLDLSR